MSGGYFDYDQHRINQIADKIDELIFYNGSSEIDEYGSLKHREYAPDVIERFKIAVNKLREAYVYAQRIDWLVSGDDDEDAFRQRLAVDLNKIKPYEVEQQP